MELVAKWQMVLGLVLLGLSVVLLNFAIPGGESGSVDIGLAQNVLTTSEFLMYGGVVFLFFGIAGTVFVFLTKKQLKLSSKCILGISSIVGGLWIALVISG